MMKIEQDNDETIKRIDELHLMEEKGKIKPKDKTELNRLDRQLHQELDRYRLHYQLNWGQMSASMKSKLRAEVETWEGELN